MTDEEAMELLVEAGASSRRARRSARCVRAKQSSCQLSTYFVGRMAFYRLRQQVQREQGEKFDLGRFHEAVLGHGTLPVKYLPELVRQGTHRVPPLTKTARGACPTTGDRYPAVEVA